MQRGARAAVASAASDRSQQHYSVKPVPFLHKQIIRNYFYFFVKKNIAEMYFRKILILFVFTFVSENPGE